MIARLRDRFFRVRAIYANPVDRQRANALLLANWGIAVIIALWIPINPGNLDGLDLNVLVVSAAILAVCWLNYTFIQTGQLRRASWLFVGILTAATLQVSFVAPDGSLTISSANMIALAVPLVAAGALLNRRGLAIIGLILVIGVLVAAFMQSQNSAPVTVVPARIVLFDLFTILLGLVVLAALLAALISSLDQTTAEMQSDLEGRSLLLELSAELQAVNERAAILARTMEMLRDRFRVVFSQIYLLDETGERLIPIINTDLVRQEMSGTHAGLGLNERHPVSETARTKQPLALSSVEALRRGALQRSSTRDTLFVPILSGGKLVGVLELQSGERAGFPPARTETARLLGQLIGALLERGQGVAHLERDLREQTTIIRQLQEQVSSYQERDRRSVSRVWSAYLGGRGRAAVGFNLLETGESVAADDLPDALRATLASGLVQVESNGASSVLHVPITFRDQTLGAMAFTLPPGRELTDRQIEMAQVVAERLALALENARLFEQSQAQAVRERRAGEIASLLIGATDVRTVLDLAAEQFNEALGAVSTRIVVQPELADSMRSEEVSG